MRTSRRDNTSRCQGVPSGGRSAFTVLELVVVIGVIIALVAATLPAFRAISDSNRVASSRNSLAATLGTARTLAMQRGRDVAVMFTFDTRSQVTTLQIIEQIGITDDAGNGMDAAAIFVPVEGQGVTELPRGAGVFGYGFAASRGNSNPANPWNWYTDAGLLYGGSSEFDPWILPRTDARLFAPDGDLTRLTNGQCLDLETFVVRYGPDGTIVTSTEELENYAGGGDDGFVDLDEFGDDSDPDGLYRQWTPHFRVNDSGDRVVVGEYQLRSVPFVVIVDLFKLGDELGIARPWLVVGPDSPYAATQYQEIGDRANANENSKDDQVEIDEWLDKNASTQAFNRYTGLLLPNVEVERE